MYSQINLDQMEIRFLVIAAAAIVVIVVIFILLEFTKIKSFTRAALNKLVPRPHQVRSTSTGDETSSFNYQSLKREVESLSQDVDTITQRLSSANRAIHQLQTEVAALRQSDARSLRPAESSCLEDSRNNQNSLLTSEPSYSRCDDIYRESNATKRDETSERSRDIINLYNASRKDQTTRAAFREKYQPFFINVANDVNRRRNEDVAPEFRKQSDGSYLAVLQDQNSAIVFPNFTLVVVESIYGPGALGEVFSCPDFDRRFSYPEISVSAPAVFKQTGGDNWTLHTRGALELGQPHDA